MKHNIVKLFIFLMASSTLFTSCIKDEFKEMEDGAGQTFLKIQEAPVRNIFFTPFSDKKDVELFSFRKDARNNAELNEATSVQLVSTPAVITQYNAKKGTTYEVLPSDFYTVLSTNFVKTATGYSLNLPSGDFAEEFKVRIDGAKWTDVGKKYALGFVINDPKAASNADTLVVTMGIKNQWDGIYTVEAGAVQRYTNPTTPTSGDALNGSLVGNPAVTLSTVDGTTVEITNMRWSGGTSGIAGIDNLRATVNPATNQVTMKALGNATLRNVPGSVNTYDPASKTFTLNFEWNPTANKREVLGLVLKYSKER